MPAYFFLFLDSCTDILDSLLNITFLSEIPLKDRQGRRVFTQVFFSPYSDVPEVIFVPN